MNDLIKNARKSLGQGTRKFAQTIQVGENVVVSWENGSKIPSRKNLVKIGDKLGWTTERLLTILYKREEIETVTETVELANRIIIRGHRLGLATGHILNVGDIKQSDFSKWNRGLMNPHVSNVDKMKRLLQMTDKEIMKAHEEKISEQFEDLKLINVSFSKERLKELRTQRGWSQYKLGQKIGVEGSTVGQWERGVNPMSNARIKQMCLLFGIPFTEVKPVYKSEAQRNEEREQRKDLLRILDNLYDGRLADAPEDCKYLNQFRKLVGA